MSEKTFRKFRWFWAWEDEKEEEWLRQMSLMGNHLDRIVGPCVYRFCVGEPRDLYYRLDFTSHYGKEKHDYLLLFNDAGWEYLGEMSNWQYFRKAATEGEPPEIYSDPDSKIQKYRRLLAVLLIFIPVFWTMYISTRNILSSGWGQVILGILMLEVIVFVYAWVKIYQRIQSMRKKF